jgi:hypothetical protein
MIFYADFYDSSPWPSNAGDPDQGGGAVEKILALLLYNPSITEIFCQLLIITCPSIVY